jgi:hypothetical protein
MGKWRGSVKIKGAWAFEKVRGKATGLMKGI